MLGIKGKLALDNGAPQGFSGDDSVLNPKDVSVASGCVFNIPRSKSVTFRLATQECWSVLSIGRKKQPQLSCGEFSSQGFSTDVRPVGDGG